jgi:uncharacterized protein YjiS (DUF1127 family)
MSKLSTTTASTRAVMDFLQSQAAAFSLGGLFKRTKNRMARRATRRALHELSDEQLKDIGLTRSMLEDAIHHPARRYHGDF